MKKFVPLIIALGVGYFVGTKFPMLLRTVQ